VIRDAGSFKIIKLFDKIDMNIRQGPEYKVEVSAGKNLLSNIITENNNGTLTIENRNKCNFVRGYKRVITVNITVPVIQRVENRGVGTIRFAEDFRQDSIFILAENSGDTYLHGIYGEVKTGSHGNGDIYANFTCDKLFIYMFGTNSFKGQDMKVNKYLFVENISIGDCRVKAPENGKLECNIWRSGNVYYSGNPSVVNDFSNGTGTGKLIRE
jgi:hypothetical protein